MTANDTAPVEDSTDPCDTLEMVANLDLESPVTQKALIEDKLPPEILALVFANLRTRDLVQLGLVCSRWSATLTSNPRIWTDVTFDPPFGSHTALGRILSLSGDCPLRLSLGFNKHSPVENAWLLKSNMHRIVRLMVDLKRDLRLVQDIARSVADALSTAAPRLIHLRLYDPAALLKLIPAGRMFLGGCAPLLTMVKLQCVISAMLPSQSTFCKVRHALVMPLHGVSYTRLRDMMKLFPAVTELGVNYHKWGSSQESGGEAGTGLDAIALPPNLRYLIVIPSAKNADPLRVIQSLQTRTAQQIVITHGPDASSHISESMLQALLALPFTTETCIGASQTFFARGMTLEAAHNGSECVIGINMLEDAEEMFLLVSPYTATNTNMLRPVGVYRALRGLGSRSSAHPLTFVHVRCLLIAEMIFDQDVFDFAGGLPKLPQLEHLTVCLMKKRDHMEDSFISCFVAATLATMADDNSSRALQCPRLRTLRIGVDTPAAAPAQLEPGSVLAFVHQHLKYSADRLSNLFFNSVEPFILDPLLFNTMLALAEETTFDERRLAMPFVRPQVLDWD